jgi:CRISPR-associated protein Cas1
MAFLRESPDPRVVIVSGHGVALTVKNGHVVIRDSSDEGKRERILSRIDARTSDGIARIVILSETGYVSLEVMAWARQLNIGIYQLDRRGDVCLMSPGQTGDSRIRRAQVLCAPNGPYETFGLSVVRDLMRQKIAGQIDVLKAWHIDTSGMDRCLANLDHCADVTQVLAQEGQAASAYWKQWKDRVFLPMVPDDMRLVPSHWLSFTNRAGISTRANGMNPGNRHATDPINAMINYGYAVAYSEAMYACHITGLDPYFGMSHGTQNDKPAMVLDLIEPLRPIADLAVLSMLDHGKGIPFNPDGKPAYFSADCFYETGDGTCRIYPPVTHDIARRVSMAVALPAGQIAESIVRKLAHITGATNLQQRINPVSTDRRLQPRETKPRFDPEVTARDILPDALWAELEPLIPPDPVNVRYTQPRGDNRAALAGIIAHHVYGVAWFALPPNLGVTRSTCKRRLDEWERLGVMGKLIDVATRPGASVAGTGLDRP